MGFDLSCFGKRQNDLGGRGLTINVLKNFKLCQISALLLAEKKMYRNLPCDMFTPCRIDLTKNISHFFIISSYNYMFT